MSLTIRPINTGFVTTFPKQYLYHHTTLPYLKGISDDKIEMPCFCYLVEGLEDGLMLVDTGMADTERAEKYHHAGSYQPEGMSILEQLAKLGISPEDIKTVVFTHMHWDHIFYMDRFTNAQFYANEVEYQFALDPIPLYYKSYEAPQLGIVRPFEGIPINTVRGDAEIRPGVRVFETFGHSPGHQCVEIDTKDGSYICTGDAIFILDNLKEIPEIGYSVTPPARYVDIIDTWRSIEKLKARVKRPELLLPCHDASMLKRAEETPVLGL